MASIRIILRTDKINRIGEAPLYLRLTHDRKTKYTSLHQSIRPEHWQADQQRVSRSHPFSQRFNALLAQKRAELEEAAIDLDQGKVKLGRKGLNGLLAGAGGESFIEYAFDQVKRIADQGRYSTATLYRNTYEQFADWLKDCKGLPDLAFCNFTNRIANEFKSYLERDLQNHPNTIQNKFAALRRTLNLAQREGLISEALHPLRLISTPGRKTTKIIPTQADIALIEALELPRAEGDKACSMWDTRNLYLFCCRMAGMRFSDAVSLRWGNLQAGRLHWNTKKTKRQIALAVPDSAMQIIDQYRDDDSKPDGYIFPFLRGQEAVTGFKLHRRTKNLNPLCNAHLKEIAQLAGLSRSYSFHTSRHFFATEALRRGVRVEVLKEIMTHSSIEQTMAYVRISNADMDAAMVG
jgi:integrase